MSADNGVPGMVDVPKQITAQIEQLCDRLFQAMDDAGGSKDAMIITIETVLAEMQRTVLGYVRKMTLKDANSININMIMLTALIRVAMNNPMYDSDALKLQLRNELTNILGQAQGFKLD